MSIIGEEEAKRCWQLGREAKARGASIKDCPFDRNSGLRDFAWRSAWTVEVWPEPKPKPESKP